MQKYQYSIKNTGASSNKYGNCEVCGKHADTVYLQTEKRAYAHPDGSTRFTAHMCHDLFGHEQCLISKRKNGVVV